MAKYRFKTDEINNILDEHFVEKEKGTPLIQKASAKHNVIILTIEGMSYKDLYSGYTPFMDSIGEKNILYNRFVSHQRITTNGMYSIWCGDYPNLMTTDTKSEVLGAQNSFSPCLPQILKDNGYSTYFMQAAHSEYMNKDKLARAIGIDHIYGAENLPVEKNINNAWGLKDEDFFKASTNIIKNIAQENKPFFITMLNISTHHPFLDAPNEYLVKFQDRRKAGFYYVDTLIEQFFKDLKDQGLFKDTIILITADESSYENKLKKLPDGYLPLNHGILIVQTPNQDNLKVNQIAGQKDIQSGILDYLSLANEENNQRSLFRSYDTFKAIAFSNAFMKQYFLWDDEKTLISCDYNFENCFEHISANSNIFSSDTSFKSKAATDQQKRKMALLSYASDKSYNNTNTIFEKRDMNICATQNIIHMRHFSNSEKAPATFLIEAYAHKENKQDAHINVITHEFNDLYKSYPQILNERIAVKAGEKVYYEATYPSDHKNMTLEQTVDIALANKDQLFIKKISISKDDKALPVLQIVQNLSRTLVTEKIGQAYKCP